MGRTAYTGFTQETLKHLQLGAGAYFANFNADTDTYESAVTAGKLISATQGGGEFSAKPAISPIQVDGIVGKAVGMDRVDEWDVYMKVNAMETKEGTLMDALAAADVATATKSGYKVITGRHQIKLSDYKDNITFVGYVTGADKPLIIQVENAINVDGLVLKPEDKKEAVISLTYEGRYGSDITKNDIPPFKIFVAESVAEEV